MRKGISEIDICDSLKGVKKIMSVVTNNAKAANKVVNAHAEGPDIVKEGQGSSAAGLIGGVDKGKNVHVTENTSAIHSGKMKIAGDQATPQAYAQAQYQSRRQEENASHGGYSGNQTGEENAGMGAYAGAQSGSSSQSRESTGYSSYAGHRGPTQQLGPSQAGGSDTPVRERNERSPRYAQNDRADRERAERAADERALSQEMRDNLGARTAIKYSQGIKTEQENRKKLSVSEEQTHTGIVREQQGRLADGRLSVHEEQTNAVSGIVKERAELHPGVEITEGDRHVSSRVKITDGSTPSAKHQAAHLIAGAAARLADRATDVSQDEETRNGNIRIREGAAALAGSLRDPKSKIKVDPKKDMKKVRLVESGISGKSSRRDRESIETASKILVSSGRSYESYSVGSDAFPDQYRRNMRQIEEYLTSRGISVNRYSIAALRSVVSKQTSKLRGENVKDIQIASDSNEYHMLSEYVRLKNYESQIKEFAEKGYFEKKKAKDKVLGTTSETKTVVEVSEDGYLASGTSWIKDGRKKKLQEDFAEKVKNRRKIRFSEEGRTKADARIVVGEQKITISNQVWNSKLKVTDRITEREKKKAKDLAAGKSKPLVDTKRGKNFWETRRKKEIVADKAAKKEVKKAALAKAGQAAGEAVGGGSLMAVAAGGIMTLAKIMMICGLFMIILSIIPNSAYDPEATKDEDEHMYSNAQRTLFALWDRQYAYEENAYNCNPDRVDLSWDISHRESAGGDILINYRMPTQWYCPRICVPGDADTAHSDYYAGSINVQEPITIMYPDGIREGVNRFKKEYVALNALAFYPEYDAAGSEIRKIGTRTADGEMVGFDMTHFWGPQNSIEYAYFPNVSIMTSPYITITSASMNEARVNYSMEVADVRIYGSAGLRGKDYSYISRDDMCAALCGDLGADAQNLLIFEQSDLVPDKKYPGAYAIYLDPDTQYYWDTNSYRSEVPNEKVLRSFEYRNRTDSMDNRENLFVNLDYRGDKYAYKYESAGIDDMTGYYYQAEGDEENSVKTMYDNFAFYKAILSMDIVFTQNDEEYYNVFYQYASRIFDFVFRESELYVTTEYIDDTEYMNDHDLSTTGIKGVEFGFVNLRAMNEYKPETIPGYLSGYTYDFVGGFACTEEHIATVKTATVTVNIKLPYVGIQDLMRKEMSGPGGAPLWGSRANAITWAKNDEKYDASKPKGYYMLDPKAIWEGWGFRDDGADKHSTKVDNYDWALFYYQLGRSEFEELFEGICFPGRTFRTLNLSAESNVDAHIAEICAQSGLSPDTERIQFVKYLLNQLGNQRIQYYGYGGHPLKDVSFFTSGGKKLMTPSSGVASNPYVGLDGSGWLSLCLYDYGIDSTYVPRQALQFFTGITKSGVTYKYHNLDYTPASGDGDMYHIGTQLMPGDILIKEGTEKIGGKTSSLYEDNHVVVYVGYLALDEYGSEDAKPYCIECYTSRFNNGLVYSGVQLTSFDRTKQISKYKLAVSLFD